jgi:diguanylate cyclase
MALAERIRAKVETHPICARARTIRLTLSLGVAVSNHPRCVDAKTLLQLADDALYRAKENGRNRCELAAGTESPDSVHEIGTRLVARP